MRVRISTTEMLAFLRCEREHANLYTLGFRPVESSGAVRLGRAVHAALEEWWRAGADRLEAALQRLGREPLDPFDVVRAEELLRAYDRKWGQQSLTTLGVEVEFAFPLVNPDTGEQSSIDIVGRIDALARDVDGRVWVVEHKTAGDAGAGVYWERLRIDLQCSVYLTGAASAGHDPYGILYDVVEKPKVSPLRATPHEKRRYRRADGALYAHQREADETPEEFRPRFAAALEDSFLRGEVVRLEQDEYQAARDVWHTANAIVAMRARVLEGGYAPRNSTACVRYGRLCDYFAACTGAEDLRNSLRFQERGRR